MGQAQVVALLAVAVEIDLRAQPRARLRPWRRSPICSLSEASVPAPRAPAAMAVRARLRFDAQRLRSQSQARSQTGGIGMALYEMRTYTIQVGKLPEVVAHYRDEGWPVLEKRGFRRQSGRLLRSRHRHHQPAGAYLEVRGRHRSPRSLGTALPERGVHATRREGPTVGSDAGGRAAERGPPSARIHRALSDRMESFAVAAGSRLQVLRGPKRIPHLTPTLSAPRGGEGEQAAPTCVPPPPFGGRGTGGGGNLVPQ